MATSIVNSLFGLNKEDVLQQIQQEQDALARTFAQGSMMPARTYAGAQLGLSLGNLLSNRLFGVTDPRLKRVTDIESIMSEVQSTLGDEAQDNVKLYSSLAQKLADAGYGNESLQATEMARKASLEQSQAESARIKAEKESRPEYIKLLEELDKAEQEGQTAKADGLKRRLSALETEGANKGEPSTDKLKARYIEIINSPNSTEAEKENAQRALNTLYTYTNLPAGFERDPNTGEVRPIVGGPQDIKLKEAEKVKFKNLQSKAGILQSADDTIAKITRLASPKTVGLFGTVTKLIPGEPAFDLKEAIQTIKARLSFDTLQEMRDLSKTGGALGNVSNQELRSLESSIASLEQSQSYESFMENLRTVQKHYNRVKQAVNQDLAEYQASYAETAPKNNAPVKFIPGRRYTDKNGNSAVYNEDGSWTPINK